MTTPANQPAAELDWPVCPRCWHGHLDYDDEDCVSCGCPAWERGPAEKCRAEAAAPQPAEAHGVGAVDKVGIECLCGWTTFFDRGGWLAFNGHLRPVGGEPRPATGPTGNAAHKTESDQRGTAGRDVGCSRCGLEYEQVTREEHNGIHGPPRIIAIDLGEDATPADVEAFRQMWKRTVAQDGAR